MFQVIYSLKRKNRITVDVLAAGGRYDTLLTRFHKPGSSAASPSQAAVGISIAYDKVNDPSITEYLCFLYQLWAYQVMALIRNSQLYFVEIYI